MPAVSQEPSSTTALQSLIDQFQVQLDYMRKNNSRLHAVANKLEIDPPKEKDGSAKQGDNYGEGQLLALSNALEYLRTENGYFDYNLSRLEKFI